jgi:signal transduction histidine kinase
LVAGGHSFGGRVGLSAEWTSKLLRIGVADTGVGISPADLPVFERSYRADASRSGSESGLGLAIAKSIVELHRGSIRAESTPGQGSTFIVEIPA